jgi:hypothetical protein
MKPRILIAMALAAGAAACTKDHASVEIFAVCAPPTDAGACSSAGTCEALLASPRPFVYLIDSAGFVNELVMFVQVNNQLLDNSDPSSGRVNTNNFFIEEYRLAFPGSGIPDVDVPASGTVASNSSSTPVIPLLPFQSSQALSAAMTGAGLAVAVVSVELRIQGRFGDGTSHETGVFKLAVDVANSQAPVPVCPKAGDVVTAICPNDGQTASIKCEAPSTTP